MRKFFDDPKIIKSFFLLPAALVLAFNLVYLTHTFRQQRQERETKPYVFIGYIFSGLGDILRETETIGYYTDKSLDDRAAALRFAQAQYILAPVILDFNNPGHEYVLFDCSRPETAWDKIKQIGAVPVRKNQFGIILARNPAVPRTKGNFRKSLQ